MNNIKQIIKALLFAWGDPLDIKVISEICEIELDEAETMIEELRNDMDSSNDGLKIIRMNSTYQLISRDIYLSLIHI